MTKSTKSGKAAKIGKCLQRTRQGISFTKIFSWQQTKPPRLSAWFRRKIFLNCIKKKIFNFLLYLNQWWSVFSSVAPYRCVVTSEIPDDHGPLWLRKGMGISTGPPSSVQVPWMSWGISNPMTKWLLGKWIECWDSLSVSRDRANVSVPEQLIRTQ